MENRREIHKENRGIFYMVRDTIVSVSHLKFAMCIIIIAVRIKTVPELLFYVRSMNGMRKAILVKTGQEIDVIHLGIPDVAEMSSEYVDEFGDILEIKRNPSDGGYDIRGIELNKWLHEEGEGTFPCALRVALYVNPGSAAVNDYLIYNNMTFKMCSDRTAISMGSIVTFIVYNFDEPNTKSLLTKIHLWDYKKNNSRISSWKEIGLIDFCPALPAWTKTWDELCDNLTGHGIYTREFNNQFWMETTGKLVNTGVELLIYNFEADPDEEDDPYLDCIVCTVDGYKKIKDGAEITFKLVRKAKMAGTIDCENVNSDNNIARDFIIASYF